MNTLKPSHALLVLVAAIWGFAFVAQTTGMKHLGPHSFNAARFLLGAFSLVPLWLILGKHKLPLNKDLFIGGLVAGTVMFAGFSFQQIGLQYTTAGNAGFITGMYIVMVPIAGIALGHATNMKTWCGVLLALAGLFALSVSDDLTVNKGDALELVGALFWTAHVLILGWLCRKVDAISLTIMQFLVATVLATAAMLIFEEPTLAQFELALLPLLYAGVASSGIAFTLQIIAQRQVEPSVTALILSTEAVFAVIGGWLLLNEQLTNNQLTGCGLMLLGMLISQWPQRKSKVAIEQSAV
ncbi:DMT family transporter [Neptunomonas japonica]|uniref:DMT family transporter n=1 Tax=Neptunomonas japonica TaxID=417574 RepID=UPI0004047272|nr:DMT family transporter [Neptunomonas japonica]